MRDRTRCIFAFRSPIIALLARQLPVAVYGYGEAQKPGDNGAFVMG